MRRAVGVIALAWALVGPATAQEWVVIRPAALDTGSERLARALGDAIDVSLSRRAGARRAGNLVEPAQTVTVLDCLQINDNCADRAARAVGADGAIYGTVQRAGTRVLIEATRTTGPQRRRLAWRIELGEQILSDAVTDRLAQALGSEIVADGAVLGTGLFSARRLAVRVDGLALTVDGLAPIDPGAHAVVVAGAERRIDLLPGEIVVLAGSDEPRAVGGPGAIATDRDLATPGWLLIAGGGASLLAAGLVRGAHSATVNAYADAESAATLRAAGATARSEVTTMNVLLIAGGAAIVSGVILLFID